MATKDSTKGGSASKSAGKTSAPSKKASSNKSPGSSAVKTKEDRMKMLKNIAIWLGVFVVTLVVVDYGVQYLNYNASAAIVNGERIMRGEFYDQLEDSYGISVSEQMIDEALIYQEAEKENITISDDEIEAEIKDLEDNYGGEEALQSELDARGITEETLKKQIETTLIVEKILLDDIEVTEDEKKEFFEEYKDVLFPEDEDPTYEEAEEKVEQTLRDQKLSQEVQVWLEELRNDATIRNNISEPKSIEFLGITRSFISGLGK